MSRRDKTMIDKKPSHYRALNRKGEERPLTPARLNISVNSSENRGFISVKMDASGIMCKTIISEDLKCQKKVIRTICLSF